MLCRTWRYCDGEPAKGEYGYWSSCHRKATEGFFVYMVSFKFSSSPVQSSISKSKIPLIRFKDGVFRQCYSKRTWVVDASTSRDVLGGMNLQVWLIKRWSTSDALRTMTISAYLVSEWYTRLYWVWDYVACGSWWPRTNGICQHYLRVWFQRCARWCSTLDRTFALWEYPDLDNGQIDRLSTGRRTFDR